MRVEVKNRMEVLEKNGIIKGYTTVVDKTEVLLGVQFILDVESIPELYQDVVEVLTTDRFLRQVYSTTGDCRLHAIGFAPNIDNISERYFGSVSKDSSEYDIYRIEIE